MAETLTKTTNFTGRASGDGESFCWDTRPENQMIKDDMLTLYDRIDAGSAARILPQRPHPHRRRCRYGPLDRDRYLRGNRCLTTPSRPVRGPGTLSGDGAVLRC